MKGKIDKLEEMCKQVGIKLLELERVSFGPIRLGQLKG